MDGVVMMSPDELDNYIRLRLREMNVQTKFANTLSDVRSRLENEERETNMVTQMFNRCDEMLQKVENDLNKIDATGGTNIMNDVILIDGDEVSIVNIAMTPSTAAVTNDHSRKDAAQPSSAGAQISAGAVQQSHMPARVLTVLNQPPQKLSDLAVGMKLFAKKIDEIWYKGTLVDIQNASKPVSERKYRIKFDEKGMKAVGSKAVAFTTVLREGVVVGTRVIALYFDESGHSSFYAGIIAEPPSVRNNGRYLVFFDDGYAQYSQVTALHQVYDQSVNVWEDIYPDSQDFIRSYLKQYPERPMVRLQSGQVVQTEWNGSWYPAQVLEVDASLVKMYFAADERTEWVYRGSTRLEPLYTELANAEASKQASSGKVRRRSNLNVKSQKRPFVEYTRGVDEDPQRKVTAVLSKQLSASATLSGLAVASTAAASSIAGPSTATAAADGQKKPGTARKSTGGSSSAIAAAKPVHQGVNLPRLSEGRSSEDRPSLSSIAELESVDLTVDDDSAAGSASADMDQRQRRYNRSNSAPSMALAETRNAHGEMKTVVLSTVKDLASVKFVRHNCCRKCLRGDDNPAKFKGHNPLCIPMEFGWNRQIAKYNVPSSRRAILYVAPCRRRLRNENEVDRYLITTDSRLTIDLFCFDPDLRTDREFSSIKTFCDIKDLSYSKENIAVPCVNGLQRDYPDYVEYSNQRIPAPGVNLVLDEEFLTGCDCTDGCRDRSRCKCIRFTLEESKVLPASERPMKPGYHNRRLSGTVFTGIYECNSRCKCDARCHNRVVQHGLTQRLQVFRTEKRGWGLRCLNDIPSGGFVCIYAGQLLNDEGANEDGKQFGDEYLAELDLIEVVEKYKEGYESDVVGEDDDDDADARASEVAPAAESSESEFDPNANHDSDSTYSGTGRRRSKRSTSKHTPTKKDIKTKVEKKSKKKKVPTATLR